MVASRLDVVTWLLLFGILLTTGSTGRTLTKPKPTRTRPLSKSITITDFNGSTTPTTTAPRTATSSQSPSLSLSRPLAVLPAVITLHSAVVIDSQCIVTRIDSSESQACRTMVFSMINDGFPYTWQGSFNRDYRRYLISPSDGGASEPFGLAAQWDYISEAMSVTANVSHLIIMLPRVVGLVQNTPGQLIISFTGYYTLRGQDPLPSPTQFVIGVTATTPSVSALRSAVQIQTVAGILSALTIVFPLDPGMLTFHALAITDASVCTESAPRVVLLAARRALFPSIETDDYVGIGVWHNLIILLVFALMHVLVVYAVMQRYACSFMPAAGRVYFPSVTLACITLLQPGIAYGSFSLLFSAETTPLARIGSIFSCVYCGLVVILPVTWLPRYIEDEVRDHHAELFEFPVLLRKLLPTTSWGPDVKTQPWGVPFGAMREQGRRYASLHLGVVSLYGVVFAVAPPTPQGCAAQVFIGLLLACAHAYFVLAKRPYRATSLSVMSAISAASVAAPLIVSFAHTFAVENDTGSIVLSLVTFAHVVIILRVTVGMMSHVTDLILLRPRAWPDAAVGLPQPPVAKPPAEAAASVDEEIERHRERDGEELFDPMKVYLHELREHERQRALEESRLRELRDIPPATRDARIVLGPIEPLPVRAIPRRAFVQSAQGSQREPALALHRFDGPLPPGIRQTLSREYSML